MEFIDFEAEVIDDVCHNNENEKDDIADKSFYKWWCQSTRYQTRDIFDALNYRNRDNCKLDKRNSKPEMY